MIVQHRPQLHLTYCQNIHPGESWAENFAAIRERTLAVKARVQPEGWFGLGLRLSAQAVAELSNPATRDEALDFFAANQLYPYTVNAFAFGPFHGEEVKENAYAPDWRTEERRDYTLQTADLLVSMLPAEIEGSISTVAGSFKPWITTESDKLAMARQMAGVAAYLSALEDDTGRLVHLGLEPEPDCFLETTAETVAFFKDTLYTAGANEVARVLGCSRSRGEEIVQRHLGVCFDTCHVALQFEDLFDSLRTYQAEGIRISKVQLSAALQGASTPETWEALRPFCEPVYLHQVKALTTGGGRAAWYDLPDALEELPDFEDVEQVRVHFHVPLHFTERGPLQSTIGALTPEFLHHLRTGVCPHLEIETYTWEILPEELQTGDLVKSIGQEYAWVLNKIEGL